MDFKAFLTFHSAQVFASVARTLPVDHGLNIHDRSGGKKMKKKRLNQWQLMLYIVSSKQDKLGQLLASSSTSPTLKSASCDSNTARCWAAWITACLCCRKRSTSGDRISAWGKRTLSTKGLTERDGQKIDRMGENGKERHRGREEDGGKLQNSVKYFQYWQC